MKKLTLDPETLRVQSFPASPEVRAHAEAVVPAAVRRTRPQLCDPVTAWCE
jgi:hypothetical protein